jgi:hypothetical protein
MRTMSPSRTTYIGTLGYRSVLITQMHFPLGWDPFFRETMTLQDVYQYGTQHFDCHRSQLTLTVLHVDRAAGSEADG